MTAAGVDAVVTSTGLAPRGASPLDVELLRGELDPRIAIKAVGGIRTVEEAADLLAAGAGRIGTSTAPQPSTTAPSAAREPTHGATTPWTVHAPPRAPRGRLPRRGARRRDARRAAASPSR